MMDFEGLLSKFTQWKKCNFKTKKGLIEMANTLDKVSVSSMKTKILGLSIGITGSSSCMAGIILAPHTFGLSLGFTVSGIVIGTIGSIISIYGEIKEDLNTHKICQEAEKLINLERKETDELIRIMTKDHLRRSMEKNVGGMISKSASEGLNIANIVTTTVACQNLGDISNASKILLNQSAMLTTISVGVSILSLTLEIVNLVETVMEYKEVSGSVFGDEIRNKARDLDYNMNELQNFFDSLLNIYAAYKSNMLN